VIVYLAWLLPALFVVAHAAAQAPAPSVSIQSTCTSPERERAIEQQLDIVRLAPTLHDGDAGVDATSAQAALRASGATVLLVLDDACNAQIFGIAGQTYKVAAHGDVNGWAVRVAEIVYALSPYDTGRPPVLGSQPAGPAKARDAAPGRAPTRQLAALAGPVFVSGADHAVTRIHGSVALAILPWLDVEARADGILPDLQVGSSTLGAKAQLIGAALDARARIPLPTSKLTLQAVLGAGPQWLRASGAADAPRVNRRVSRVIGAWFAGLDLTVFVGAHAGVRLEAAAAVTMPGIELELGATKRQPLARVQAAVIAGPVVRF